MSTIERLMQDLNPHAMVGEEDGYGVVIEDVTDPDGRMYRIEYRATPDAQRAIAYCLHNPWGIDGAPSAGETYLAAHVDEDGFLCLGTSSERLLARSPYGLEYAVRRARYWCTAFSVFRETGTFPNP